MSEAVAVPGANLQLRGHQQAVASGEQEVPDHGETVEEDHEECQGKPSGKHAKTKQTVNTSNKNTRP